MNKENRHRGPDGTGFWLGDGVSLGHNRLSIIDLSDNAKQPMADLKEELIITFNGEIYNYKELRADLEKKYNFRSQSDTEVILYAYKEYGADCVKKFNGIFAFAIWDVNKEELFLARDHIGIKPLYYFGDGKRFIFSSEIKSILTHDIPRAVDKNAFNLYFHLLYVPEPYTMFDGIKKLPPASYLLLKNHKLIIKRYWQAGDFENFGSESEAIIRIQDLFKDSVRGQLISDRPVGVFLSGGIDSTAILGAVSERASEKVKTFSVGFDIKAESEKFNADFLLAKKTSEYYQTEHNELFIGAKDIGENLEKIAWHLDEPNANPTAGAIFLLSRFAKEKVAVVLGGDGGDELFGGYPRYLYSRLISFFQKYPAGMQSILASLFGAAYNKGATEKFLRKVPADRILDFLSQKQNILNSAILPELVKYNPVNKYFTEQHPFIAGDFEKYFMNVDRQSWLVDESLMRTDKMTMAFGFEERVPILDYRLVELANKIPTKWKLGPAISGLRNFQGKRIWRKSISKYLLPHMAKEQKRGWFTPMAKWIRNDLQDIVSDILSPGNLNKEFFNPDGVQKIWQEHLNGRVYNLNLIWAIVMWQFWYNSFIKNK